MTSMSCAQHSFCHMVCTCIHSVTWSVHAGMLYPVFVSESAADAPDGAKVIRCVAVFVGIYQASNVSSTSLLYSDNNCLVIYSLPALGEYRLNC